MTRQEPDLVETRTADGATRKRSSALAQTLGRYTLLSKVGQGGMGQVYAAYDPKLDRRVALKLLHVSGDAKERARLEREAKALAKVSHPNVLTIYEVDVIEERVVLALEYVSGRTLKQWIAEHEPVGHHLEESLDLLTQAGRGLAAAHARGLVHRDFKPSNVLVGDDGRVRVADFGLARPTVLEQTVDEGGERLCNEGVSLLEGVTQTGRTVGTPRYMAPEQFAGGRLDAKVDQFAFCLTAWEVLTGNRPFLATDYEGLRDAVRSGKIATVPERALPGGIEAALRKGLRSRPSARWADLQKLVNELEAELRRVRGESGIRRRGRRWGLWGAGMAVVALGVAADWANKQRKAAICNDESVAAAQVWDETLADEVMEAIGETNIGKAIDHRKTLLPLLDRQADALVAAQLEVCRRETIEETWDTEQARRARWCLERRRVGFSTLVDGLREPHELRAHSAIEAASALEVVTECLEPGTVLGGEPVPDDSQLDAVRRTAKLVAEGESLLAQGSYAEAEKTAIIARGEAEEIGWLPLVAQSEFVQARALVNLGDSSKAGAVLRSALAKAVRVSDWSLSSSLAAKLFSLAWEADDLVAMRSWDELASATAMKALRRDGLALAERERRQALVAYATEGTAGAVDLMESALARVVEEAGPDSLTAASYRLVLAEFLTSLGDWDAGEEQSTLALRVAESTYGEGHPSLSPFYIARAGAVALRTDFGEAAALCDDWLETLEASALATDRIRSTVLQKSGNYWRLHGEHEKALDRLQRVVTIADSNHVPPGIDTLLSLGSLYGELGRFDEGESVLRRGLGAAQRNYGERHQLYAQASNEFAQLLARRGKYEEALPYALRALSIHESERDAPTRDLGLALSTIGVIYSRQERDDAALPYQERAARVNEEVLGEKHPDTARAYSDLALTQGELGRHDLSIELGERALRIRLEVYGEENPWTAQSYSNIGRALRETGQYDDAVSYYTKCIRIRDRVLPPGHHQRRFCHGGLGGTYSKQGKPTEALREFLNAWTISFHALGTEHPSTQASRQRIADLCETGRHRPACAALAAGPPAPEGESEIAAAKQKINDRDKPEEALRGAPPAR